ncbi:putative 4-coumarate- ligase protein [Neofusicoccum parvum UCRNP2]|uniref:Putative 4-coumarate-ligase protein n=1 Tax=Botryosphaeria parva (strain UCR-NP2) TaxID=1287680 RepID=R1H3H3_BOTPV|nr:putative 4-coumarate- ligase protein [Neofusicoccum parvum UCRNP2]
MPFLAEEHLPIPDEDILSWIFDHVSYNWDMPIYIDAANPARTISARQALDTIGRLITGLKAAGVQQGDCICYPLAFLGIIGAGGIFAGTNPSYTTHELTHAIRTASIKHIIVEPPLLPAVLSAARTCSIPDAHVILFDPAASPPSPSPSPSAPHAVSTAQPTAYWAGRFASLFDRQRLAAFHAEGQAFRASGRVSDTFAAFVEADDERRARRVLAELAACCVTDDAARSLRAFQREFARRCGNDALMPSPALIVLGGSGGGGGGGEEGLRGGEGKGRKTGLGFMERLRGIAREARKSSV